MDRENIELSDIITFHFYGDYTHARRMVKFLKQFNRPLINTEWMHNLYHADFTPYDQEELDILRSVMKIRISGNKELGETKTLTKKKKFDKLEK